MKTKFIIFGLLFFTGVSFGWRAAEAKIQTCLTDYYGFIITVRSEATRSQLLKDFTLGYCQLNDITELEDQLDTIRENFRSAAENCSSTDSYKKEYVETLMEEYFVRNIQKQSSDALHETDEAKLKELKKTRLDVLKKNMREEFVSKEQKVTDGTFDLYFADWSSKYDDRILTYAHCEEGPWAELSSAWKDFIETIQSLNIDVKKPESGTSSVEINNDFSGDKEEKDTGSEGKTIQQSWSYYQAKKEQREAGVMAATTVQGLNDTGRTMTFEEALNELKSSGQTNTIETHAAGLMATYDVLYGSGSGVAATDMQSTLVYMNQTLEETNRKDFPNITKAVNQVYGKQCR